MGDFLSKKQRSALMANVRRKNTNIETVIFKHLRLARICFTPHANLPGTPDIAFPYRRVAVFIDGDFWHGRRLSSWSHKLSPQWLHKIVANVRRDRRNDRRLRTKGWSVLHIWGSQILKHPEKCVKRIEKALTR